MHFMVLILLFLLGMVLWGFFHSNPQGVSRVGRAACNALVLAAAVAGALASALILHGDALARRPEEPALAIYLAVMAGGTAFMILATVGGLLRNFAIFPPSRRAP